MSLTSLKYDPKHYEYFKLTPGTLNTWFKLGIILSPKVWGQGIAKQSIDLVSNYLFQHSNAIGIYAKVKNTNEKSVSFFNNSEFKKINLSFDLVSTHNILETDK